MYCSREPKNDLILQIHKVVLLVNAIAEITGKKQLHTCSANCTCNFD